MKLVSSVSFKRWEYFILLALFLEIAVFGLINSSFFNFSNLLYTTSDFAHILLVAVPLTLVVITGGIDISIASMMGLTSIVTGFSWQMGLPIGVSILAGFLAGFLAGLFNGLLVSSTDIPAIVITLGTMFLYSGLATGIAGSLGASGYNGIGGFPEGFVSLAYGGLGAVPNSLIIVLLFSLVLSLFLKKNRVGRSLYLIGDNMEAARYSGIKIRKTLLITYSLTGIGAAIAGILLTSYFTSARSDLGSEALLPALTAVVLGGTDIQGGKGSVAGTLIAGIFLGVLKQGLMSMGVTNDVSQVVTGFILIATVVGKVGYSFFKQQRLNRRALRIGLQA
ncbi:ABC transporter permease [Sediminispirochaeta smaragdinae]|uniref:Autoinducer 2 import system permease protein LsrD n=1 Tax=Sediminispirochaeta smaragdinae (strain DSM 11293 / JCM 15392 / SEBR 4228) TaxID=573413 RepID=E1R7G1_SEDSS|nr:ABC transporter permease [Sediminispirochaeta smaragdinae]ADK82666.1 inner-membrane translocator [Sediminispirochaeta smaragdinae DSM 11293]